MSGRAAYSSTFTIIGLEFQGTVTPHGKKFRGVLARRGQPEHTTILPTLEGAVKWLHNMANFLDRIGPARHFDGEDNDT